MKNKSITLNFIMNFILTASSVLFPLITFPYASRVLGPSGTGLVAMGTSLVSYFTMVAMLGVPTYGIRACAAVRDDKEKLTRTVQELLIINLIMAVISYAAFFITISLVPSFSAQKMMYTICSAAILLNVLGVNWVYQALEEYSYITMASILFKVLGMAALFAFVRNADSVLWYAAVTVISSFGSGLLNFIRLGKIISLYPVGHYSFAPHLRSVFTFFAMAVATTVYTNMDTLMLGLMKTDSDVGYYNAAIKVKTIMVTMVTSLGTVLLPRLSYYYEKGEKEIFDRLISKAFSFVLLFAIPVCVFFSVYAREVVLLLSGSAYLPAVSPMIILMPTILLIGLSNITGIQVLVPSGRENLVLRSVVLGAVVDFGLNLLFIPRYASSGASFGTLMAELAVLVLQVWYLRNLMKRIVVTVEFKQLILSLLVSVPILILVHAYLSFGLFLSLVIGAVCFFGVYGLMLLFTREEIVLTYWDRFFGKAGCYMTEVFKKWSALYDRYLPWLFVAFLVLSISGKTMLSSASSDSYSIPFDDITSYVRYLLYLVLAGKCFLDFVLGNTNRIAVVLYGLVLCAVFMFCRDQQILIMGLAILSMFGMEQEKLLNSFAWTMLVCLFVVIFLASLSVVENKVFDIARLRQGLGFFWTTLGSIYFLFAILALFAREHCSINWVTLFLLLFLTVFFFLTTNTRFAFLVSLVAFSVYALHKVRPLWFNWIYIPWMQRLIIVLPFVIALFCFLGSFFYSPDNPVIGLFDKILSGRLQYTHAALEQYPITLFGSNIEWNSYGPGFSIAKPYNFVDCSFIKTALNQGLVYLVLYLSMYSYSLYTALKKRQTLLACMIILVLGFSITEVWLTDAVCNPFVYGLAFVFSPQILTKLKAFCSYFVRPEVKHE